jgi:hypothetical protein
MQQKGYSFALVTTIETTNRTLAVMAVTAVLFLLPPHVGIELGSQSKERHLGSWMPQAPTDRKPKNPKSDGVSHPHQECNRISHSDRCTCESRFHVTGRIFFVQCVLARDNGIRDLLLRLGPWEAQDPSQRIRHHDQTSSTVQCTGHIARS